MRFDLSTRILLVRLGVLLLMIGVLAGLEAQAGASSRAALSRIAQARSRSV